jgi:hypothetical protein
VGQVSQVRQVAGRACEILAADEALAFDWALRKIEETATTEAPRRGLAEREAPERFVRSQEVVGGAGAGGVLIVAIRRRISATS